MEVALGGTIVVTPAMHSIAISCLFVLSLVGCGDAVPPRAKAKSDDALPKDEAGDDVGGDDGDEDLGGDDLGGGGDDFGEVDAGDDEVDGPTLEELTAQCGDIDTSQPDKEVLAADLTSLPIVARGTQTIIIPINYTINLAGQLGIRSTISKSTTNTQLTVVSAQPALAQNIASTRAADRSGTIVTEFVPVEERSALGDRGAAWESVFCTIQPGTKVTSELGGNRVVTTFDPPLPASVSPKADPERYAAEMGQGERVFTGIEATVVESANPAVAAGSKHVGTVKVTPISATYTHRQDDGTDVTVGGDLGYEVSVDFGTPEITNALGLKPVTRFYIDHATRNYKAVVAESQDGMSPTAVFIGN
jgi:hypothetical protein